MKRTLSGVDDPSAAEPDVLTLDSGSPDSGIRCPLCGWTPRAGDRWRCQCGHSWNTFDTGGVCPSCLREWDYTQCLACHQWSLHSDWYPKG